ncbi:Hypothetical predicted protein [Mytilus galloprovincialis]|uniref:Endonuclease/exonuclease/phosphatase domain-containing protein n=1 Tax=Mytilus galloprovincialis TaxID=29158 RepID=A0A8B6CXB6_MYTGA|nr:Hypothetical predicted protein [Mytilus galloprovincialis]
MASKDNTINYIMVTGDFNDNQLAPVNSKSTALSNIDDSSAVLREELHNISDDISYIELTVTGVEDILKIVNPTKASGPDLISPKLLKEASSVLKYPLCKLFNLSLSTSTFPDQWKRANVTPVYKNSKPNDVKNYRPMSLLV